MNKIAGIWYALSYKLGTHYLGGISLHNWLWGVVVILLTLAVVGRVSWWWAVAGVLVSLALWGGGELARHRRFVHFVPGSLELEGVTQQPIVVDEHVPVRASGEFAVGDGKRLMLNEPAIYTFVRTREHVLMVHLKRTRFLLFARSNPSEVGWWYAFFKPEHLIGVQSGRIADGLRAYPCLALTWQAEPGGVSKQDGVTETVYIGSENPNTLARILDDLRRDTPAQAFEPTWCSGSAGERH